MIDNFNDEVFNTYVSKELAELAYTKGFDQEASEALIQTKDGNKVIMFYTIDKPIHKDFKFLGWVPTHAHLQKWLRDRHNIFISIDLYQEEKPKFSFKISQQFRWINGFEWQNYEKSELYGTYEEANEYALKTALNILKDKVRNL